MELFCKLYDEMLALYNLYTDRGIVVQDFLRRKGESQQLEYRMQPPSRNQLVYVLQKLQ